MKENINGHIYCITNLLTNQQYVGSQISKYKSIERYSGSGSSIKKAIKENGLDSFHKFCLEENITTPDELREREIYWINKLNTFEESGGYNKHNGGGLYSKLSKETREKMSQSRIGIVFSNRHIENIRKAKTGKKNNRYNTKHTEETKQKMSKALMGEKNPMFGGNFSEEHRRKISEAVKNRVVTDETKYNLSKSNSHNYVIVSPDGKVYKEFNSNKLCNKLNISYHVLRKNLNTIITRKSFKRGLTNALNTIGWIMFSEDFIENN